MCIELDEKQQLLARWQGVKQQVTELKPLIDMELELRRQVVAAFFPQGEEGVNNEQLGQGWLLKATVKMTRTIDPAVLEGVLFDVGKVYPIEKVVRYKPELINAGYKELEQISPDAYRALSQAVITKPASPELLLVPPKQKA